MSAFNITDRATWPEVMTAQEVADVLRRKVGGVVKECQQRTFVPAPFQQRPRLWRKSDVLRHIDGAVRSMRRAG